MIVPKKNWCFLIEWYKGNESSLKGTFIFFLFWEGKWNSDKANGIHVSLYYKSTEFTESNIFAGPIEATKMKMEIWTTEYGRRQEFFGKS